VSVLTINGLPAPGNGTGNGHCSTVWYTWAPGDPDYGGKDYAPALRGKQDPANGAKKRKWWSMGGTKKRKFAVRRETVS
jgi:hypothetical protein